MSRRLRNTLLILVILAVIAALAALWYVRQPQVSTSLSPAPTTETTQFAEETPAVPAECPSQPVEITDPQTMTLLRADRSFTMMNVGTDAIDAAGAPPNNESHTVAWWQEGPAVGSHQGKVVLTAHTFHIGNALGNELQSGLMQLGDYVLITNAAGEGACYRYSGNYHILVADYDPESDILYDNQGDPKFALVVCSDYVVGQGTLGRMIYYADLVA